jgi:hypothetical protein
MFSIKTSISIASGCQKTPQALVYWDWKVKQQMDRKQISPNASRRLAELLLTGKVYEELKMKRKIAIVGTFWLVVLACLILVAANPFRPAEPNLDFSEGCLRGYLWDTRIQHIACGLPAQDDEVVPAPVKPSGGERAETKVPDDGTDIVVPPPTQPVVPLIVPPITIPEPPVVVPPTPTPHDPVIVQPPTDEPRQPAKGEDGKKCPKQDNVNKQGHHDCGKSPRPGEHDNGNGGGNKDKPHGQDKSKGKNK